ncbi:glutamine amidotransferase [Celeribacter halophilus]|uniref:Glutamine amidotransferase n=1 Tax=Celeribacter halophilus TaxID=576117 RepID=A0AAW7XUR0_9RHOB|nr:glutamine amidotransferase [Celeribacter halophilus]MDO6458024.1 glutamine amidotransferase [Celeribacter halophilus]
MGHKVLLVGESWITSETHYKGFDQFGSVHYHLGAAPLIKALEDSEFELDYMPAHEASEKFPFTREGLDPYDVVILSDIGSNTFLLPPDVWLRSKTVPNRLRLLKDWVADGGNLMMIGGYFSFQGIDGKARWRATPVEDTLPVTCHPWDDRVEIPEGSQATLLDESHPVFEGIDGDWPPILGVNEVIPRQEAQVLARLPEEQGAHPLLVLGTHVKGRTAAWTSDIGPHWLSPEFCGWNGYEKLWKNLLCWLIARD